MPASNSESTVNHLARASAVRQRPLVRDRFLLLAAGEADRLGGHGGRAGGDIRQTNSAGDQRDNRGD